MLKTFILSLFGSISLILQGSNNLLINDQILQEISAHVPSMQVQVEKENDQNKNVINVNTEGMVKSDLVHLLYGMARKIWLTNHIFPLHGACIGNDQIGYFLIVGENGAGKSTTSLSLIRDYSLQLFSGDKTLIKIDDQGKMMAVAGTKMMTLRSDTDDQVWDSIIDRESFLQHDRKSFYLKPNFVTKEKEVLINGIFFIRAYHTIKRHEPIKYPTSLFVLYPHFIDQEKSDVILGLGKRIYNGEISTEDKEINVKILSLALQKNKVFNVTGTLEEVVTSIANELKLKGLK